MVYLIYSEGHTTDAKEQGARAPLGDEAIRLARLLLSLYPAEPEVMGLTALLLLQQSRAGARFDAKGTGGVAGAVGPTALEPAADRRGARPDRQGGAAPPGRPLSGAGRHRRTACPRRPSRGHRLGRNRLTPCNAGTIAAVARCYVEPVGGRVQSAWRRRGILDEYPNLSTYVARGKARPAYKRAFDAQLAVFTGK